MNEEDCECAPLKLYQGPFLTLQYELPVSLLLHAHTTLLTIHFFWLFVKK